MSYIPGTNITYNWVAPSQGLEQMRLTKRPGLFYFYNPRDSKTAYLFEAKLFEKCLTVGDEFVTMKWDSTQKLPVKGLRMPKGATGIMLLDYTGKRIGATITRPPTPAAFMKLVAKAREKNKKKIETAKK